MYTLQILLHFVTWKFSSDDNIENEFQKLLLEIRFVFRYSTAFEWLFSYTPFIHADDTKHERMKKPKWDNGLQFHKSIISEIAKAIAKW